MATLDIKGFNSRNILYLTVQGFRVSAEQQISAAFMATGSDDLDCIDLEMLREAAVTLFNQYLSDKVSVINNSLLACALSRSLAHSLPPAV